jgi:hypothetical protein
VVKRNVKNANNGKKAASVAKNVKSGLVNVAESAKILCASVKLERKSQK